MTLRLYRLMAFATCVNKLEDKTEIQNCLDRLEKLSGKNEVQFNKAKCKTLALQKE